MRVGVVGFTTEDTPEPALPGPARAVRGAAGRAGRQRRGGPAARARASTSIIALGHEGANAGTITEPTGPLVDIADSVVRRRRRDRRPQRPPGATRCARTACWSPRTGARASGSPAIRLVVDERDERSSTRRPTSTSRGPSASPPIRPSRRGIDDAQRPAGADLQHGDRQLDACPSRGRTRAATPTAGLCESLVGNVVTDAMRTTYGADFAITNSGGLRADLTCPTTGQRRATSARPTRRRRSRSRGARCCRCCRSATSSSRSRSTAPS